MSINDYTRKREKGKHLTLIERSQIEVYLKLGKTRKYIAEQIGVSERTIYREIKRGRVELLNNDLTTRKEYVADVAMRIYEEKQSKKEGYLKIGKNHELARYIERKIIEEKYLPYATLIEARKEYGKKVNFCLKTLYNYIHGNIFLHLSRKHLIYNKKQKARYKKAKRIIKLGGDSIEKRSEVINQRKELGHWEMDTVVGKRGKKSCLLVLTERVSRKEKIIKIKEKKAEYIIKGLEKLKKESGKEFIKIYKSITSDNGSEFSRGIEIEKMGIEYFYAHSYCAYERGSNENNNRFIRRFIDKGVDIKRYSNRDIKNIEEYMNNYPRKMFGGLSSNEVYDILYNAH